MVVFNPQAGNLPNDNMPNFFKYSDSISQPKADESKGIALKTLGVGIEGGAELADTVVKDVIKTDAYNRVDTERDKFTTALSNAATYGDAGGPQPVQPDSPVGENGPKPAPVNLLANNNVSVPTGISKGISAIARNEEGLKQDKVTQLEYIKNLNSIAKDMRATYPGYREYVDNEISKITGMNPANAVIDSYISNINAAMANKNKDQDYWRNKIVESGYPDSDKVLAQFERDGNHSRVMQYLSYNNSIRSTLALKEAAFKAAANDRTTQQNAGEDLANTSAMHAATTFFYNSQKFANGDQSPADIADKMADLSLHPEKANDVAYQGLSARYAALHTQAYNQTMRFLNTKTKNPDGTYNPSVADVIGAEKTKSIVDKSVGALFDKTREFIADKQFGPAYSVQNSASATVNNAFFKVLTNPTIAGVTQTAAALNKAAPNFVPFMTSNALKEGVDANLAGVATEMKKQAGAQTGGKYFGVDGKVYTFKQSLEELDQVKNLNDGKEIPGAVIKDLVTVTKGITDKNATTELKSNAIKYFYDSVNNGTMSKLMDDYYDPARGGMVAGRTSAFKSLTAPDVTKSIWEHGQEHPGDWGKYSNWAKSEAAVQIKTVVSDLNRIQGDYENKSSTGLPGSQVKVAWDTEKHNIKFLNHDGTPLDMLQSTVAGAKLSNLNGYLTNLANIAKREGSNVDAFVFKVLKDAGWSPTKEIDGVPAQLMRGMIISNGGKVNEKGPAGVSAPVSRFAPEDVGGDLKSFLTNPAGPQGFPEASGVQSYQTRNVIKGNLSDETLLGIQTDEIPEGMSARDFIRQLKSGKKLGGSVQ